MKNILLSLLTFDVTSLYSMVSLAMVGVIISTVPVTRHTRVWSKGCAHCGGDQFLDYEGRMYSTVLVAVKKCILCSRTEEIDKDKFDWRIRPSFKLNNRIGR